MADVWTPYGESGLIPTANVALVMGANVFIGTPHTLAIPKVQLDVWTVISPDPLS